MTAFYGSCSYKIEKFVSISPFDPDTAPLIEGANGIESVTLYPNPNNGQFAFYIKMFTKQQVFVRVIDIMGQQHFYENYAACTELDGFVSLPNSIPGIYIMTIVSENDAKYVRFIVE